MARPQLNISSGHDGICIDRSFVPQLNDIAICQGRELGASHAHRDGPKWQDFQDALG